MFHFVLQASDWWYDKPWYSCDNTITSITEIAQFDKTPAMGRLPFSPDHKEIFTDSSLNNHTDTGLILGLCPANERRRYKVTPSLIGWAQT